MFPWFPFKHPLTETNPMMNVHPRHHPCVWRIRHGVKGSWRPCGEAALRRRVFEGLLWLFQRCQPWSSTVKHYSSIQFLFLQGRFPYEIMNNSSLEDMPIDSLSWYMFMFIANLSWHLTHLTQKVLVDTVPFHVPCRAIMLGRTWLHRWANRQPRRWSQGWSNISTHRNW